MSLAFLLGLAVTAWIALLGTLWHRRRVQQRERYCGEIVAIPRRIGDEDTAIADATGHAHHYCDRVLCPKGPQIHPCHNPRCWKRASEKRLAAVRRSARRFSTE